MFEAVTKPALYLTQPICGPHIDAGEKPFGILSDGGQVELFVSCGERPNVNLTEHLELIFKVSLL